MYQVEITVDEALSGQLSAEPLEAAARATLAHQNAPPAELTILITGDEMLTALNQSYRGMPVSTDVLAFPYPAGDEGPSLPIPYLGDIAISLPRAREQATAGGHTAEAELHLLIVHGVLHLLGHNHAEPEEKARMWAAQGEILRWLRVSVQMGDE